VSFPFFLSRFFETVLFPLIKQISFATTQVHDLGTPVAVLLLDCALLAIIGIRNTDTTTNDAATLSCAVIAFVTYPHNGTWGHI